MLDPLTTASTLATIVGLLCNFKQERGANQSASRDEFLIYLENHRHETLKNLIVNTHTLSEELNRLLLQDTAIIARKLNEVNDLLAIAVSKIDGLAGIARYFAPNSELSENALGILRIFYDSGSETMNPLPLIGETFLHLSSGAGIKVDQEDARFLDDDLTTLCNLSLISQHFNKKGEPFYRITRRAKSYLLSVQPEDRTSPQQS